MTGRGSDPADLQRRFAEVVARMELDDLKELTGQLLSFADRVPAKPEKRPSLRKPRRSEPGILRVRVDLEHAKPPIWRRLDVRSDIGLDTLHQVLQAAFGWTDSHLHASHSEAVPSTGTPSCSCARTTPKKATTTARRPGT